MSLTESGAPAGDPISAEESASKMSAGGIGAEEERQGMSAAE